MLYSTLITTFLFTGINQKNMHSVKYPDVLSAIKPVPHGPGIPIPEPRRDLSAIKNLSSTDDTCDESANDLCDQPTCDEPSCKQPKLLT